MGLACNRPYVPGEGYAITYFAPQPRAVLQVVDPESPARTVEYDEPGRVRLTTLTREFFVPGFLERDEACRSEPITAYPSDGVRDVRHFGRLEQHVVVGLYSPRAQSPTGTLTLLFTAGRRTATGYSSSNQRPLRVQDALNSFGTDR